MEVLLVNGDPRKSIYKVTVMYFQIDSSRSVLLASAVLAIAWHALYGKPDILLRLL